MVNVNEESVLGSVVYPLCLNSILEKKAKENKGKEFLKEIVDKNDESPHTDKPQQMPNSKYIFYKNPKDDG